jgi:diaminohydroxyphosphoribosylaminopyrimidine deaminase/5-amino-6-(5-phosphoribosylamino)uracil reductase
LSKQAIAKSIIIVDSQAMLALDAGIWQTASRVIVLHGEGANAKRVHALQQRGATTFALPLIDGQLDLSQGLHVLASLGFHDIWLEAGATLFSSFATQGLMNEAYCYIAPWWAGVTAHSAFVQADFFKKAQQRKWLTLGDDAALHLDFLLSI